MIETKKTWCPNCGAEDAQLVFATKILQVQIYCPLCKYSYSLKGEAIKNELSTDKVDVCMVETITRHFPFPQNVEESSNFSESIKIPMGRVKNECISLNDLILNQMPDYEDIE